MLPTAARGRLSSSSAPGVHHGEHRSTGADLLDDAVVPEGATDEVSHCLGSSGPMVSQLRECNEIGGGCLLSWSAPGWHHDHKKATP
jgi:hypothetical protein